MRPLQSFSGLLALVGLIAHGGAAQAWVRSRTNGCHPVYWSQSCIYLQPDGELTKDLPADQVQRIIQRSIAQWQDRIGGSFLRLIYVPPDGPREARFDRQPTIKFRTGRWCRPGDCQGDRESCYDASAAAITTVFFVNKPDNEQEDGLILDADIELNSVHNQFYDADQLPPRGDGRTLTDLENTLVHELGHLMGLEHTCRSAGDGMPDCTVDHLGQRPPLCSTVLAGMDRDPRLREIAETTMFATAQPRETKKRTPEADDVAAIVAIYPAARDPRSCERPRPRDQCGGGGCALAPHGRTAAAAPLLLLGAILLCMRQRRQSGRTC
ncbi:MAG: hypothetical protein RMK29_09630 [Myxococcales bacterium]|nr:hypothetical protein [Myxococcales bacterium]